MGFLRWWRKHLPKLCCGNVDDEEPIQDPALDQPPVASPDPVIEVVAYPAATPAATDTEPAETTVEPATTADILAAASPADIDTDPAETAVEPDTNDDVPAPTDQLQAEPAEEWEDFFAERNQKVAKIANDTFAHTQKNGAGLSTKPSYVEGC